MTRCPICGCVVTEGMLINGFFSPIFAKVCENDFEKYMNRTFGEEFWRESPESVDGNPNAADGFYDVFNKETEEWEPWEIYYTTWEEED